MSGKTGVVAKKERAIFSLLYPVRAVFGSVALLLLGNGLINTVLTLRGTSEGFSSTMVGLIMSAYFVGFTCGTWVSSRLIRRMGHIRAFAFSASICASGVLLHLVFIEPEFWLVLRFAYGLAFVTVMTVIESWLNSKAAVHERGRLFALYMVVNLGAVAAAQQLLRLSGPEGFLLFALAAIFMCWAVLPLTMTRRNQPKVPDRPKSSIKALVGFAPIAVTAAAMSGLAMGAFWTMTPVYTAGLGFSTAEISVVMSLTILGGALLQVPIGRFSDRHDRHLVMILVALAASVVAFAIPLAPDQRSIMALFFLWGGLSFALYPLAVAQLIDQLHPDEVVSGSADMLVLHGAGSAVAPILAGFLMSQFGLQAMPLYLAGVLVLLAGYAFYRCHKVSTLVAGHTAHFEPMVQTTPEAFMMFDQTQPDLFADPDFYDEGERRRLHHARLATENR